MLSKLSAAALLIFLAMAVRASGQCREVEMGGFTAINCDPPKGQAEESSQSSRSTYPTYPSYRPATPGPAGPTGFGESLPGDAEKYKKFRERNPTFGMKKPVTPPPILPASPPPRHDGEYRIAMLGGGLYWSKEKPALKNNVYSFQSNGVLMAVRKSEVSTIDPPAPSPTSLAVSK